MGNRPWGTSLLGPWSHATRNELVELSPIKAVELEASRIPDVVSLAQGIPSFDTPEPIKRFVRERLTEDVCARYSVTPGLPRLREAISETLLRDGMAYDPDGEIVVTAGSIEAIAASLLALVQPGDEVLVVSPTYASYIPAIHLAGAVPRFVPLAEDANFDLDPDAIAAAAGRRTTGAHPVQPEQPDRHGVLGGADPPHAAGRRTRGLRGHRRRSLQGLPLRRRPHPQRGSRDLGASPRAAGVLVLESLRDDGVARGFPARARTAGRRRAQGARRAGHLRAGGVAVRGAGRARAGRRGHRRLPCRVPPPPRSRDRAARPAAARLRLPEAQRVLLRLPAGEGHRAAGARFASVGVRHPGAGPGRPGAGRGVRAHGRGASAAVLRAAGRRRAARVRSSRRLLRGAPGAHHRRPCRAGVCSGGARYHPSRRRGAAARTVRARTWRASTRASSPSRGRRARR